ncbi:MAG TPA: PEP-CTERM sorting domain-containing protein [Cellvibrio sp.]|nr:PEP-CTERM sorting domain-containing protein [Cellvibrio sp.]
MRFKNYRSLLTCLSVLLFFCTPAQAVIIDFDDLDPSSLPNEMVTNEYESQGVVFAWNAYLVPASTQSAPNYVIGPGIVFNFINTLPTYVSFYTGSSTGHKVFISALGPNNYFENIVTEGEIHGMNYEESTPYVPNQFVVFQSESGIASIELSGQSDGYIDDLTFYYPGEEIDVPEPSGILLLMLGMLGFFGRWLRAR